MDEICFMFGHRTCPESLFPKIVAAIREHIEVHGCDLFVVGSRGEFDRLASRAVAALKPQYPGVKLWRLEPYYHPHKPYYTPEGVDNHLYPQGMEFVPKNLAILKANEIMIDDYCSTVICFVQYSTASNTYKLLERAKRKEDLIITNLAQNAQP